MSSPNPIAYLTLEIKNRELDSRLMIATYLLHAGITVVVGQQWGIFHNIASLPRGIILFKTVNRIQAQLMKKFCKAGHVVAATDEEVLLCTSDACFCSAFSEIAANNCHVFFAQSESHKAAVEGRFPELVGKVKVTGNPRIDSTSDEGRLQYLSEATAISREVGPFILFNTNFAVINSIWGSIENVAKISTGAGVLKADDPESVALFRANADWERRNRDELVMLMHWCAKNLSSHKIVIRPHPGEQIEFWQDQFGEMENVKIVPRSHHMPWLMAADVVVHTSCTTGLEAALLDKPALSLTPLPDPEWARMTNVVNPCFPSWAEAASALQTFLMSKAGPLTDTTSARATLESYFPGHRTGRSARNIAKGIVRALDEHRVNRNDPYIWNPQETGFSRFEREPRQVDKFSVGIDELVRGLKSAQARGKLPRGVHVTKIDDSLYMLVPI